MLSVPQQGLGDTQAKDVHNGHAAGMAGMFKVHHEFAPAAIMKSLSALRPSDAYCSALAIAALRRSPSLCQP